jgi:hypothetical protein
VGCSIASYSKLQVSTSFSKWDIERWFRSEKKLSNEDETKLVQLAKDITALQESFPVQLDWTDVARIRQILLQRKQQQDEQAWVARGLKVPPAAAQPKPISAEVLDEIVRQTHP